MKTYPYQTPDGIIQLVEKRELDQLVERLTKAEELIREIRDDEVNPQDEADKFLRDHQPSELATMRADNAELIVRLAEARESHLAASARDVQTIQRQAIMLERLADAARKCRHWHDTCEGVIISAVSFWNLRSALSAYEASELEPVNPIDEAVKRLSEVTDEAIESAYWSSWNSTQIVRNLFIQAAKGGQI